MKIQKFIQNNEYHLGKYIIKGYAKANIDNKTIILFYFNNKKRQNIVFEMIYKKNEEGMYNQYIMDKFDIPSTRKEILFDFYRIIGYKEISFHVETKEETTLTSDILFLKQSNDNKIINFELLESDRYIKVSNEMFFKELKIKNWVPNKILVHDGKMHTDDIFSVALVKYINPNVKIIRTREIPENFDGIIADVGGGRYDHHNLDKPRINIQTQEQYKNEYGEKEYYAAFGLLAKDLLPGIVGNKAYNIIDQQYIRKLDDADNNGTYNELSVLFELFNPTWDSNENDYKNFIKATNIAITFLNKIIEKEKSKGKALPYVLSKIREMKDHILLLDKTAPWQGVAKNTDALLCVYPVSNGWAIQCVKSNKPKANDHDLKMHLPQEWIEDEIPELLFCHKTLFFAIFKTKEKAIEYAHYAIQKDALKNQFSDIL